jgi:hypothetical protein
MKIAKDWGLCRVLDEAAGHRSQAAHTDSTRLRTPVALKMTPSINL